MKTRFLHWAAIGFAMIWGLMLLAVPLTMEVFRNFKIEMPGLTMWMIGAYHFGWGLALPVLVLATALLLGLRQSAGWMLALILCVGCDLAALSLILPFVVLANTLSAMPLARPFSISSMPGIWLAVGAVFLNQILFVLLLFKRRDFLVAPQSDGSLLPIR